MVGCRASFTKADVHAFTLEQKRTSGDVLTVTLKDGFTFTTKNQFFNKGADSAEDILAFLRAEMAGTQCEISLL